MDILIVIEDNNSKVHRMGIECIAAAQKMAKDRGLSIAGLVMGIILGLIISLHII